MLTLLINESNPLDGLFANSTTGGVGTVPDITVADAGQAVSVQSFTRAGGIITDSFVAGDALHIGIGDGVNAPVCYVALSSASPATGTMPINTAGMVALFAATVANQLSLTLAVVRTRGAYTNTIFSAPIVIRRSAINISTAVPTPSILGTGVAAALQVAINTALGFVRLDASARYPALDGSQITNLAGGSLTVGTSAITSGTTTRVLFDNAGVLGEYAISGTGSVAMTTSPSLTTPTIGDGTEAAPSLSFTSDTNTGLYRPTADTVGIVGGGNDVVRLTGIASATDYIEIKNGIGVGSPLHVLAEGASANIGVHLQPKGSGLLTISDGTDFNKGIRFRSSSSAASAITLLDAVSTAGRVITLPDATGTLALVSGDLGTPTVLVGTNISGTAASLTAGNATLAATVTVANEATDTTCFPLFATAATGSLGVKTNAGFTYNSAAGTEQLKVYGSVKSLGVYNVRNDIDTIGFDISGYNTAVQLTAGMPYIRVGGGASESLFLNAGLTGGYVAITKDLGDGILLGDGTGGNSTYLKTPATGTLRVTTNGSTLGTVDAATFTGNAATATKWTTGRTIALTGDVTYTSGALDGSGNVTGTATLANIPAISGANLTALNASNVSSGTLADARLSANVPLKDAANTFTAENINSKSGAASVTAMKFSGVPFAGTGTTSFPLVYINDANATASTTLNTAGTYLGVNGDGTQDLMNLLKDGTSQFKVTSTGNVTAANNITSGANISGANLAATNALTASTVVVGGSFGLYSASAGVAEINNGVLGTLRDLNVRNFSASGTLAVTGATTLSAALITTPEALAPALNAGAACGVTKVASGFALNGVNALTLANGTNGQIKTIVCTAVTAAGTATLTPTTCSGFTTVAFTAAGQTLTLQYFTTGGWHLLSVRGATPA